ncbi:hypothetical protein [Plantactinospora sp. GCM10030261]|uniref:hypothetical protein n=1 Tax=Plantactinospora sp. GCM10030261 TaxID=3273420 RepID=UPI0036168EFF
MRRTGVRVVICALVVFGLSGCQPATEGVLGVRLDAQGRLVGVFDWCDGKAGARIIVLHLSGDDGGATDEVVRLDRVPGRRARAAEEVVILDPSDDWRSTLTPTALGDDRTYNLDAWNKDDGMAHGFPFEIGELRARADSGAILTKQWRHQEGRYIATFHTPESFARHADAVCRDG